MEIERIYFRHYRSYKGWDINGDYRKTEVERYIRSGVNKSKWPPLSKGGRTEAVALVTYGDYSYEVTASTDCRPDEAFEYSEGRKHSLYRLNLLLSHVTALENLAESKL